MKTKNGIVVSIIVSASFVGFSIFFIAVSLATQGSALSGQGGMRPMDFPRLILSFLLILSIGSLIISVREALKMNAEGKKQGDAVLNLRIIVGMLSIVVYAIMWNVLGFTISSILYIFGLACFLNNTVKWWQCLLVAAGFTVLVNFVFVQLFSIIFPEPLWDMIWRAMIA